MRMWPRCIGLVTLLWVSVAGQTPSDRPTFRASQDLTVLDVTVLDRNRRPIRDLQASDFVVKVGGRVLPVVSFAPVALAARDESVARAAAAAERDVVSNDVPRGRFVVILFDRTIPYGHSVTAAKRFALSVVDALGPEDVAAIIATGSTSPPQNFTADRGRLRQAIEQMTLGMSLSAGVVTESATEDRSAECYCDVCSVDALTRIANVLADIHAQPKVAFFIGQNLKPLGFHRMDYLRDMCAPERIAAFNEMTTATERAKLFVHSIDPTGLEAPALFSARRRASGAPVVGSQHIENDPQTLLLLADVTGGRVIRNSNDPSNRAPELLAETDAFYLLGIGIDPSTRRTSRIEVSVTRRGAQVRTRSRLPEIATSAVVGRRVQNAGALPIGAVLPSRSVPMSMQLVPMSVAADDRAVRVAALLRIGAAPAATPPGASGARTVRVIAFDTKGREQASSETRLPPHPDAAAARDFVSTLEVRPGRYEVRAFVTQPGVTEAASVYGYVDVPAFGRDRLVLSGPVLEVRPRPAFGSTTAPSSDWLERSTAHRMFESSAADVIAFIRIHQRVGDVRPASVAAELLDAGGHIVSSERRALGADRFGGQAGVDERFSVALDALAPGEYVWRIRAQAGNLHQERVTQFRVH